MSLPNIEDGSSDYIPTTEEVRSALRVLAHLSVGVVEQDKEAYRATTDYENGVQLVRSLEEVVQPPREKE